ncbi:MAG: hypothetical protein ACREE0_20640 [Phenylobacterium sp.]
MHIHRPKAPHDLRELLKEIGVIVIGIAIALSGEQVLTALHWRLKVGRAEANMRQQLNEDLAYAYEVQRLGPCTRTYFNLMEAAVLRNDWRLMSRLYALGPPFDLHPWRITAWEGAVSGQVPDQLDVERLAAYGLAFHFVATEQELQLAMNRHYAEAMTARFPLPTSPQVTRQQLVAIALMKADQEKAIAVSSRLLTEFGRSLGVAPNAAMSAPYSQRARACEAGLDQLSTPPA